MDELGAALEAAGGLAAGPESAARLRTLLADELRGTLQRAEAPPDIFERALTLQHDLAHHHGLWHRTSIPDLLIAETALHHGLGVVHVDADYERIAEVRSLTARRLG